MGSLSKLAHFLVYALMLAVPLFGLPTLFYRGRSLDFGLFQVPDFLIRTPEVLALSPDCMCWVPTR